MLLALGFRRYRPRRRREGALGRERGRDVRQRPVRRLGPWRNRHASRGELGLGDDETVISRIRRFSATELNLNDNDSPAALAIGTYFDAGGDGNDLTLYLQTETDGEVSFTAASQFTLGGGNYARFTLPADAQALLDNVALGDRFIFKAARPAAAAVITGSGTSIEGEGSLGEATGQATAAVVVTGSGAAVEAEGSLGEGTGQAIAVVVVTGSGTSVGAEGSLGEATGQVYSCRCRGGLRDCRRG